MLSECSMSELHPSLAVLILRTPLVPGFSQLEAIILTIPNRCSEDKDMLSTSRH